MQVYYIADFIHSDNSKGFPKTVLIRNIKILHMRDIKEKFINNCLVVCRYFKTLLLLLRRDVGKVRGRCGDLVGGQQSNYRYNNRKITTDVISCRYF